ncbi:MAG: hypothetical protein JJD92_13590 [Frankiaceae bacterium]|nr:hypothetical protein [Frankiaceae bacterium]
METLHLHLRNGEVSFRCTSCAREFAIDRETAFVLQLREITTHACSTHAAAEETFLLDAEVIDLAQVRDAPRRRSAQVR